MRKLLVVFAAITLVLAACNSTPDEKEVAEDKSDLIENETDEVEQEDEQVNEESNHEKAEGEDEAARDDRRTAETEEDNKSADNQGDSWSKPDKIDNMDHLDIVHLAYDIFEAQDRKDYDFLESVASKGTTVDSSKDGFSFENVTYPFDMDFFTKEELGELELRYTQEDEDGTVIVGFGAINYEEESSFVIDFEFVQEGSKWKMQSMDINA